MLQSVALRTPPLPPRAGLGFKPEHLDEIIATGADVGFFEVHAENYMGDGGAPLRALTELASRYPLSLHGVGLSIGADRPLDKAHLARLRRLVDRYRPQSFSEHLAWSTHEAGFLNDLLPLPYTQHTLDCVTDHVAEVQQTLGCRMLLENPSTYVLFNESTIDEVDFLAQVSRRSGCGLLLDVNNVMVSAVNHRWDPYDYIDRFPIDRVGEIHLGGHDETADGAGDRLLIDAHASAVAGDVLALYRYTIGRTGPLPTLIEWDNDVPAFPVFLAEATRVEAVLAGATAADVMARRA